MKLLAILIIIILNSCSYIDENSEFAYFTQPYLLRNLPRGDDYFSTGFRDGCYNSVGQNSFGMLRIYDHPFNPDISYIKSPLYKDGYKQGGRYCSAYVNKSTIL